MICLEISQDASPSKLHLPGELCRRRSVYFSPGHLRRALVEIKPGSRGQTQMQWGKRKVGGHAGEKSAVLGYKAVGLLLVPFLCRTSLSSGKEESEVRYSIWSQHGHLSRCVL